MSFYDKGQEQAWQEGDSLGDRGKVARPDKNAPAAGGWQIGQTIIILSSAIAASFLCAWMSRDVSPRPFWMMGLIFFLPAFAVLLSAYLVERQTSAMTPRHSRKSQMVVVLVAGLLAFLLGLPTAPIQRDISPKTVNASYLVLLDSSSSMEGVRNQASVAAVKQLLDKLSSGSWFGLMRFTGEVEGVVPMAPLDAAHKDRVIQELGTEPSGGTDFDVPLTKALDLVRSASLPDERKRQTPLFTLHASGALIGISLATWSSMLISILGASCINQVR